jgi:hypothetical protein
VESIFELFDCSFQVSDLALVNFFCVVKLAAEKLNLMVVRLAHLIFFVAKGSAG